MTSQSVNALCALAFSSSWLQISTRRFHWEGSQPAGVSAGKPLMFGTGECFVVGVACCARAGEAKVGDTIIDTMVTSRKLTILIFQGIGSCGFFNSDILRDSVTSNSPVIGLTLKVLVD